MSVDISKSVQMALRRHWIANEKWPSSFDTIQSADIPDSIEVTLTPLEDNTIVVTWQLPKHGKVAFKYAAPYSNDELVADAFPDRGTFCPTCECFIPDFSVLSETDVIELRRQRPRMRAMKTVREKTGCSMQWAKIYMMHVDGPHTIRDAIPCPYCDLPLVPTAKQCTLCKMDWHDPNNPVRRGPSLADLILNAEPRSTIPIRGRLPLGSAMLFAELKRPEAGLKFEVVEL